MRVIGTDSCIGDYLKNKSSKWPTGLCYSCNESSNNFFKNHLVNGDKNKALLVATSVHVR